MSRLNINIGTTANDKTGDPLRTAFDKVNQNFIELYSLANTDVQIPSQTGNNGKFLTTNGTTLSWATVSGGGGNLGNLTVTGDVITSSTSNVYLKAENSFALTETYNRLYVSSDAIHLNAYSLSNYNYHWKFRTDGKLELPEGGDIVDFNGNSVLSVPSNNSWTTVSASTLNTGPGQVVWTSTQNYISSAKLIIQLECDEVGDSSGWHSHTCEAIIACRGYANSFGGPGGEPVMSVYGVVHTSVDNLVSFTVQRNQTTKLIEVVGTLTAAAATSASLRIHSVEMATRD